MAISDGYDPQTHTYWMDGRRVPSVTQALKASGAIDTTWLQDRTAMDRGTRVHLACERFDRMVEAHGYGYATGMTMQPIWYEDDGYWAAYARFVSEQRPVYTAIEEGRLHATLRFGGRTDRICADLAGQGPAVLEIKTGQPAAWHGLQLAGYQLLFPTGARWAVYLKPSGKYDLRKYTDATDYSGFMQALDVCRRSLDP